MNAALRHEHALSRFDPKNRMDVFQGVHIRIRTRFADENLWMLRDAAGGGHHRRDWRLHSRVLDPSLLFLLIFVLLDVFAVLDVLGEIVDGSIIRREHRSDTSN